MFVRLGGKEQIWGQLPPQTSSEFAGSSQFYHLCTLKLGSYGLPVYRIQTVTHPIVNGPAVEQLC